MERPISSLASALVTAVIGLGCQADQHRAGSPAPSDLNSNGRLAVAYRADSGMMASGPNLYEFELTSEGRTATRRGDLPSDGGVITLEALPTGTAEIEARLFSGTFKRNNQTHFCKGESVALVAGETATTSLRCYSVAGDDPTAGVETFLKIARLDATLEMQAASPEHWLLNPVSEADGRPSLFAHRDQKGRRISLRFLPGALVIHVGGEVTYVAEGEAASLASLLDGQEVDVYPMAGRMMEALSAKGTLSLDGVQMVVEEAGALWGSLPILLENEDGTVRVKGRLIEEPADSEFTIASYNVENLFDQKDDDRNAHYGDYRIRRNSSGQASNYGESFEWEGRTATFTDVKIAGIRRVLQGIYPTGPEVIALQEVETEQVLHQLLAEVRDLGYREARFSRLPAGASPTAIGLGILSKYPIEKHELVRVPNAPRQRPIVKTTLDVRGHPFVVYNNHWKSKGGKESQRLASALVLQEDIRKMTESDSQVDYAIVGDFNSAYNEAVILENRHNDTDGRTGINHVLRAQGDELKVVHGAYKYNLNYELNRARRFTYYNARYKWSSLDHIVIGPGLYDLTGITYVDNSFDISTVGHSRLKFLFAQDGTTVRWRSRRSGSYTRHQVGGYSDHTPIFARFHVAKSQSTDRIWLDGPSRPDGTDETLP